jgi:hypothetical protein
VDLPPEAWYAILAVCGTLLGAAIGGAAAYWAAVHGAERQNAGNAALALQAAEDERMERRAALARSAAVDLLEALYVLRSSVAYLHDVGLRIPNVAERPVARGGSYDWQENRDRTKVALDAVRRADVVSAPLVDPEVRRRWSTMRRLAVLFAGGGIVDEDLEEIRSDPAGQYNSLAMEQARLDLINYTTYVHKSIMAMLDGEDLPPHADPPELGRGDYTSAWQPPAPPATTNEDPAQT